jgi:hypothetical protein
MRGDDARLMGSGRVERRKPIGRTARPTAPGSAGRRTAQSVVSHFIFVGGRAAPSRRIPAARGNSDVSQTGCTRRFAGVGIPRRPSSNAAFNTSTCRFKPL